MKKFFKKIAVLMCVCGICQMFVPGYAAAPGTSDDPLISMSYVNDVLIPQIQSYVDSKVSENALPPQGSVQTGGIFNVVNVSQGQKIIGSKSCQIILRMGSATVIATQKGGLADVTAGIDLSNGTPVPANHLLIIPLDDTRGIKMETDGILMINGAYSVSN